MCTVSEEIQNVLQQFPSLQIIPGNKVRCKLTGHELPLRLPELQKYTSGKKYRRIANTESPFDYSQFEPHIVPSTKNSHQLFCKLTLRHINKVPQHVLRHVSGKRYQKALKRYEECQQQNIPYVPVCLLQKRRKRTEISDDDRKHQKKEEFWEPDSSDGEEDSDDSMSDLYPAEIFGRDPSAAEGEKDKCVDFLTDRDEAEPGEEDGSAGEEEIEKMDIGEQNHNKRKMKHSNSFQKKFKNNHRKPKHFKKAACKK